MLRLCAPGNAPVRTVYSEIPPGFIASLVRLTSPWKFSVWSCHFSVSDHSGFQLTTVNWQLRTLLEVSVPARLG